MKTKTDIKDRFVIIMAGGRGERFWPLSREKTPKQLLAILGKKSFLQEAVEREEARDRGERVDLPFEPPAIDVDFSDATNPVEVPVSESRAAALKQKIKGEQNGKKITVEGADGEQLQPESVECDRRHDGPPCADPDCYLMSGDPEPDRSTDA